MSSLALARKYRPQGFDAVVGQETTVRILRNALSQKRLHHAYLFTGPRGIGKTTLARIFAKALNCQKTKEPSESPCNECVSCREITEGRSLSVQEIDGASNTSVDDVRDLREKIRYLPPGGRYKIYIIDEVHMLSTAAFNALLKTLEEPPPHALFLFATTDPQKVPATVLSRVIRFDLRPISRGAIVAQMKKILASEDLKAEEDALYLIAREADGGLRDALSLLDQVISFSDGRVTLQSVEQVVGVSTRGFLRDLLQAVFAKDAATALRASEAAFQAGLDPKRLALDLLETFRHLLVVQISREAALFDLPQEEIDEWAELVKPISPPNLDRLFRITQKGVTDLLRAPLPRLVFDVLVLRLASAEDLTSLEEILTSLKGTKLPAANTPGPISTSPVRTSETKSDPNWGGFLTFLRTKSVRLAALVEQGSLVSLNESEVRLRFPSKAAMTVELLKEPERESGLAGSLKEYFGRPLKTLYETEDGKSGAGVSGSLVDEAISLFEPADVITSKRRST